MTDSYSLFDLHKYIKQVFALNFADPIWIHAEISQANEVNGQVYIDLIQKGDESDHIIAQGNAILRFKQFLFLKKKIGKNLDALLQAGVEVKVKVLLEFHERYGYKLMIEDMDPSYTIGKAEMRRLDIIKRLDQEGLTSLNEGILLPTILQRIAIISSKTAAGYKDFIQHLLENKYGYQFKLDLYQTSMQGQNTSGDLVHSINRIKECKDDYDCIIVIRGGGAKLDLASFDDYDIGYAIATSDLPVICGIGHEIDHTVADTVANLSLKTPTAVADFIITRCLHFESDLLELGRQQQLLIQDRIHQHKYALNELSSTIKYIPLEKIQRQFHVLDQSMSILENESKQKIQKHQYQLNNFEQIVQLSNPIHILKKGFVIVEQADKIITSVDSLKSEEELSLRFHDGVKKLNGST